METTAVNMDQVVCLIIEENTKQNLIGLKNRDLGLWSPVYTDLT